MQARIAIECQAIRLACERANIADFERLQRALAKIGETIDEAGCRRHGRFRIPPRHRAWHRNPKR